MSRQPVTQKQKDFVREVATTFNPGKSLRKVYGNKADGVGLVMNSEGVRTLMNDPRIGLDDGLLLDKLRQALGASIKRWDREDKRFYKSPDWSVQIKALELAFRLKGYLSQKFSEEAEEKFKQITVNFNLVKARDTNEVKKLLGDMPSITVRDAILKKTVEEVPVQEGKIAEF